MARKLKMAAEGGFWHLISWPVEMDMFGMRTALVGGIFLWDFMGGLFLRAAIWKWGGRMLVTLPEAKEYLRVDAEDEDALILGFIGAAQEICMDVARVSEEADFSEDLENAKAAVLYTVAYMYEHREEADHRGLMLTLRALLFGVRREGF